MAVLAIVLGVFAILSSLGGALSSRSGTSFFALNTRWEGDWNEVMRSGCAFAVASAHRLRARRGGPSSEARASRALTRGSRWRSARSGSRCAGDVHRPIGPAEGDRTARGARWAIRDSVHGPKRDRARVPRGTDSQRRLHGRLLVHGGRVREPGDGPVLLPDRLRHDETTIVPIGRRAATERCACSTGRVRAVPIWVRDGGDLIEGKPIAPTAMRPSRAEPQMCSR
jgi:hypothetical protein